MLPVSAMLHALWTPMTLKPGTNCQNTFETKWPTDFANPRIKRSVCFADTGIIHVMALYIGSALHASKAVHVNAAGGSQEFSLEIRMNVEFRYSHFMNYIFL